MYKVHTENEKQLPKHSCLGQLEIWLFLWTINWIYLTQCLNVADFKTEVNTVKNINTRRINWSNHSIN